MSVVSETPAQAADRPDPTGVRAAQLVERLGEVRRRIAQACVRTGRDSDEVSLIAVTKTFPAEDVRTLAGAGVLDVGENKDQEARSKRDRLTTEFPGQYSSVRWHHVGVLQRNKCRSVMTYAAAVHSVDRLSLVRTLGAEADRAERTMEVFLQVSLDADPGRAGAPAEQVAELADEVAATTGLTLAGVMAVAPRNADPGQAFARLADVSGRLRADHPAAVGMSAGMSADFVEAIEHGATHLRIGTALLGGRPPTLG